MVTKDDTSINVPFPNILICSQSMHSKDKVRKFYPHLEDSDIAALYGFGIPMEQKKQWRFTSTEELKERIREHTSGSLWKHLEGFNMTTFMNETSSVFMVWSRDSFLEHRSYSGKLSIFN